MMHRPWVPLGLNSEVDNVWQSVAPMHYSRSCFGIAAVKDVVVVAGGETQVNCRVAVHQSVEMFVPPLPENPADFGQWTLINNLTRPFSWCSLVVTDFGLLVIGTHISVAYQTENITYFVQNLIFLFSIFRWQRKY